MALSSAEGKAIGENLNGLRSDIRDILGTPLGKRARLETYAIRKEAKDKGQKIVFGQEGAFMIPRK